MAGGAVMASTAFGHSWTAGAVSRPDSRYTLAMVIRFHSTSGTIRATHLLPSSSMKGRALSVRASK